MNTAAIKRVNELNLMLPKASPAEQAAILDELIPLYEANRGTLKFAALLAGMSIDELINRLKVEREKLKAGST